MMRRLALVLIVGLISVLLVGCDDRAEDKEAIRALFANIDNCYNNSDGSGILGLHTQSTFEYYDRLLPVIMDGTRETVKTLPPGYQYEVVLARIKSDRATISRMTGRQYFSNAVASGWYVLPPEYRTNDTLGNFQFLGEDEAWADVYTEGEATGLSMCFRREDGMWKLDEPRSLDSTIRAWQDAANAEGKTLEQYILYLATWNEEERIPATIWDPMPR